MGERSCNVKFSNEGLDRGCIEEEYVSMGQNSG